MHHLCIHLCIYAFMIVCFCRILLDRGLDVNKVAKSGGTAIMFSAGGGHNETTAFLIERGADVNVVVLATPEYLSLIHISEPTRRS